MRVVFSRKGMDASYGGLPSPWLEGEPLWSAPIPSVHSEGFAPDAVRYDQVRAGSQTQADRIAQLAHRRRGLPHTLRRTGSGPEKVRNVRHCHLDPDLVAASMPTRPEGWRPSLGQVGAAQSHLTDQGIGPGDLFLFFGWFRRAERTHTGLRFVPGAPDLHVFFGWLEIGEVVPMGPEDPVPSWLEAHPHAGPRFRRRANNTVYAAAPASSWHDGPGAGVFDAHPDLVLTAPGMSRSRWALPRHLRRCPLTYHSARSWRSDHFQSAAIGQEFVLTPDSRAIDWVRTLLTRVTAPPTLP